MPDVILGFGANLGDPAAQISEALRLLEARGLTIEAVSSGYLTEPVGGPAQPPYINAVAVARTELEPRALLATILQTETVLGRVRTEQDAPRMIDIDILSYDNRVIDEPGLIVPHPRLHARAFVLEPLAEVAPEWRHPITGQTAMEMIERGHELGRVARVGALPPRTGITASARMTMPRSRAESFSRRYRESGNPPGVADPARRPRESGNLGFSPELHVGVPGRPATSYEVRIGWNALEGVGDWLRVSCPAHRYVIISDDTVAELHAGKLRRELDAAGLTNDLITFPAGERNKTRTTWATITDRMLEIGVGRDGAVIAFGGGVTGDLAGFVAATYLRGIPYVQIPTTLLAMIDSSVGGKTGVDTAAGKNLVGAFHPPAGVTADLSLLQTLPARELLAGFAEAIKHGAIADREHFEWIAEHAERLRALEPELIGALVRRSVEIKAAVVVEDEREAGPRKMLNFGHTIGHAVEAASAYEVLHGEAVAIGMVVEARIGEATGVTESGTSEAIETVVERFGLPTRVPDGMSAGELIDRTRSDKKTRMGTVEYALLQTIGHTHDVDGRWSVAVNDEVVQRALMSA